MSKMNPGSCSQMITLAGALVLLMITADSGAAQRFVSPDSLRQLQSVVPLSGPPGTRVQISSENLNMIMEQKLSVQIQVLNTV